MLLVVIVLAAVLYSWRAGTYLEGYYAAAVRSMSMSWHNFVFGAFDPSGTVTLDKLPGAFWVQALSVRLFGLHTWTIVLPQVVEGVLSVLTLFRIVRRLCGPSAGILAAVVLAISPATVALNRGNISDTLMILLLLLAADSAVTAVMTGRWSSTILAGIWVGLVFQAKMIEAWIVLPALWLIYLIVAVGSWRQRLLRIGALSVMAAVMSLSLDGRRHPGSYFVTPVCGREPEQLRVPAGLRLQRLRTGGSSVAQPAAQPVHRTPDPTPTTSRVEAPTYRLTWEKYRMAASRFTYIPRRWPHRHPPAAESRSTASELHPVGSLAARPCRHLQCQLQPELVLCSCSLACLRRIDCRRISAGVAGASLDLGASRHRLDSSGLGRLCSVAVPEAGTGLPGWLVPGLVLLTIASAVGLLISSWDGATPRLGPSSLAGSLAAILLVPAMASASIASNRLGPFDTPFQPVVVTHAIRAFFGVTASAATLLPQLEQARRGAPFLMATQTSALAAPFIFDSGQEVLPIGGFTGTIPEPSLPAIKSMVREGKFHLVLQAPSTTDPRLTWIARHCISVRQPTGTSIPVPNRYAIYYCLPSS